MALTRRDVVVPVPSTRYVIVHHHIFKNGGSTLEGILESQFRQNFATLHGPQPGSTLDASHLEEFLLAHPGISAVSSHHLRYPKPTIRHTVLFDCCFLRDPLDRLHSFYTYLRQINSTDPLSLQARRPTPSEFMEQLVRDALNQVSNVQVTLLATGGAFTRPASERDLERATSIVLDMAMPGVVEMFDESLVTAEQFLKPAFPMIRLDYLPRNTTRPLRTTPDEKREDLLRTWGSVLYQRPAQLNQMDLELVARTRREVSRRLDLVSSAEKRVAVKSHPCRIAKPKLNAVGADL